MQLYHHPYSLDSQKVRLALEEKDVDYWSYRLNPLKARNLDSNFLRMNPAGKIPVLTNGEHVISDTLSIIQYIDSLKEPLGGDAVDREKMLEWMKWINAWNPKLFTLGHVPQKYRLFFSRFQRRAIVTRMAESSDLIDKYRSKLQNAYVTEEQLKDKDLINNTKEHLIKILDAAENQLLSQNFLAGGAFSMADCMFVPILARIELLNLSEEYISTRTQLSEYWNRVKERQSYRTVIGKYFSGWRKYKTLYGTYSSVWLRNFFRRILARKRESWHIIPAFVGCSRCIGTVELYTEKGETSSNLNLMNQGTVGGSLAQGRDERRKEVNRLHLFHFWGFAFASQFPDSLTEIIEEVSCSTAPFASGHENPIWC